MVVSYNECSISPDELVECWRHGGLVALPTDTLYGLTCSANSETAMQRIYIAKQRDPNKLPPLLVSGIEMVQRYCRCSPQVISLMQQFWPGALTVILPARPATSLAFMVDIGVRMPAVPRLLAAIAELDYPIVGTSANLSGEPPPRCREELFTCLRRMPDKSVVFCDITATVPQGVQSTVVKVDAAGRLSLVRPGAVDFAGVERVYESTVLGGE